MTWPEDCGHKRSCRHFVGQQSSRGGSGYEADRTDRKEPLLAPMRQPVTGRTVKCEMFLLRCVMGVIYEIILVLTRRTCGGSPGGISRRRRKFPRSARPVTDWARTVESMLVPLRSCDRDL